MSSSEPDTHFHAPRRQLTWFDATSIIVGTIIGAGIYQTPPQVASSVQEPWSLYGLWLVGGIFSLCGAMCYAELASAFPRTGGDYVYLRQAYGKWAGFIFGWMQMLVIRPGDIAIIAFLFATYFAKLLPGKGGIGFNETLYAAGAVLLFTGLNVAGVRQSKWVQNLLTALKVLGLFGIVGIALLSPASESVATVAGSDAETSLPLNVALILVLFTYGGWNEMAYLAAEVKNPERNMVRSLVSGTLIVTLLYLLINVGFVRLFGLERMSQSTAIATDAVEVMFPAIGGKLVSLLICISTLGTLNGMILAGSRISYALGTDHRLFEYWGRWDPRTGTPIVSLAFQGIVTLMLILLLQSFTSALLYTSAAVYTFYLATVLAVPVLRYRLPAVPRPYRVHFFPIPMVIFAATCLFLIYSAVRYRPYMAVFVMALGLLGLAAYFVDQRMRRRAS